jgi:zinc protease
MKKRKSEIILIPEKGAPLVHVDIALRHGSLRDVEGKDGAVSLAMSMLLRGTSRKTSQEFHSALDRLGAEIQIGRYKESTRIYGVVLAEKLSPFLDLLEEMLLEPRFEQAEFLKVKSIFKSSLMDELSSDDEIAERRFQEYCLWGSPYGKLTSGSLESIDSISIEDAKKFHQDCFRSSDFVIGATGGFDSKLLRSRFQKFLKKLPSGSADAFSVTAPKIPAKKNLLLLHKPEGTQCQVLVGATGISFKDKDYLAMVLANHVFGGGSFSARLMKEVREKRGWSYGAYSWYKAGKFPLYFAMQATPSNKDAIPALDLMVKLYKQFAQKGITKQEFEFAKKSLLNQGAFLQDTIRKRLDNKVSETLLDLPAGYYDSYRKRLQRLSYGQVQLAIRRKVNTQNLFAMVLGDEKQLAKALAGVKGFRIWVRPYDSAPTSPLKTS